MSADNMRDAFDLAMGGDCFTPVEKKIAWEAWQAASAAQAAEIARLTQELADAKAAPVHIPAGVQSALDRMCEPLHASVLKGATAEADARCMEIIRRHIESTAAPVQATPTANQLIVQLHDDQKWTIAEQNQFAVFLRQYPDESSRGIQALGSAWKYGKACAAPVQAQGVLTDEQIDTIQHAANAVYAYGMNELADELRALLAAQAPASDALDAARYRFLRDEAWRRKPNLFDGGRAAIMIGNHGGALDTTIDAAIAVLKDHS